MAKKRETRGSGRIDIKPGDEKIIGKVHEETLNRFERLADSPFYVYTLAPSTLDCFTTLGINKEQLEKQGIDTKNFTWNTAPFLNLPSSYDCRNALFRFSENEVKLLKVEQILQLKPEVMLDELPPFSKFFLEVGYELVRDFNSINDSSPRTKAGNQSSALTRMKVGEEIAKLEAPKPESFREGFRRYIPRWMHHPLEIPVEIPPTLEEKTRQLWSGYTSRDAHFLIHPDQLAEGKAPFHMAMTAASAIEKDDPDFSYSLKTATILQTLGMEHEKFTQAENPEMPFFHHILAGVMVGDLGKPTKGAHFDYQQSLQNVIKQTFVTLADELENNRPGKATTFLDELSKFYGDNFQELVGRSLMKDSHRDLGYDSVNVLHQLSQSELPWGTSITETVTDVPSRRVVSVSEAEDIATRLPVQTRERQSSVENHLDDVEAVLGQEDLYNFTDKVQDRSSSSHMTINVDLDKYSEYISVVLRLDKDGKTRYVPFNLSFSGEPESFQLSSLDQTLSKDAIATYSEVVLQAISREAEKIRRRQKKEQQEFNPIFVHSTASDGLEIRLLTRGDRLRRYAEKNQKEKRGRQKITTETAVFPAEIKSDTEQTRKRRFITGNEKEAVENFLTDQRIKPEVITADEIIARLAKHMENIASSNKMVGEKINLDMIGQFDNTINIRQVGWRIRSNPIRLYLQDMGGGEFKLRGIMHKKTAKERTASIKAIVNTILDETL